MIFVSLLSSTDIFCCESDPNPCSKSILVLQHQQQPGKLTFERSWENSPVFVGSVDVGGGHLIAEAYPRHPLTLLRHLLPPSCKDLTNITLRRSPSGWTRSRSSPSPPPPPGRMHTSWNKCSKMENWFLQSWTLILHWLRSWLAISRVTSYISSKAKRWFKSSKDKNEVQTRFNLAFCGHPLPLKACTLKKHLLARVKNTLTFDKYNFDKYSFEKFTLEEDLLAWV